MFKVPLTTIKEILPHANAERLEIAVVYGFQVIVSKGRYKVGDQAIYVPIDSILDPALEELIFPPDSKVKLHKSRVRQIKLRGIASQGMLLSLEEVAPILGMDKTRRAGSYDAEQDLAADLGVTKYEPPQREDTSTQPGIKRGRKRLDNPNFHQYNGLDNVKWYPEKFKADEQIVLQEKIHGTNARAAILPMAKPTLANLLLAVQHADIYGVARNIKFLFLDLIGKLPATEFCYGSNRVQLQNKNSNVGFYGFDLQGQVFGKLDTKNKLKVGESIYGEIYGEGIQKNYNYGTQEPKFVLFDVKVLQEDGTHRWLNPDEVAAFAKERGFDLVPELYRGPYTSLDFVKTFSKGNSVFVPSQKVREGVVIKAVDTYNEFGNKRALKVISEDYLDDKSNTDFH